MGAPPRTRISLAHEGPPGLSHPSIVVRFRAKSVGQSSWYILQKHPRENVNFHPVQALSRLNLTQSSRHLPIPQSFFFRLLQLAAARLLPPLRAVVAMLAAAVAVELLVRGYYVSGETSNRSKHVLGHGGGSVLDPNSTLFLFSSSFPDLYFAFLFFLQSQIYFFLQSWKGCSSS